MVFELSLIDMGCHGLSFDEYSVDKQINKIINRPKNDPQGMNDKKESTTH